jgi:hypothetical protein
MSTCNFVTQRNFPLYAFDLYENLPHEWVCPDDGGVLVRDGKWWTCPECGCSTLYPEADGCWDTGAHDAARYREGERLERELEDWVNPRFDHWRIAVIDGYYNDWQLVAYLEDMPHGGPFRQWPEDPSEICTDWGDEEDDARVQAAAAAEMGAVRAALADFGEENGFVRLNTVGVFSNGEAIYEIAERGEAVCAA